MAPNLLGSLAQYDTPPPAQGNTPIPNSQHGGADKGPQTQKRKRAGSKSDKEQPIAPQKNVQNQKKAKMTQKEQANHREDPSPANQEERGQTPLPLQNAAAGTKTPQPYSLPDIASRNSPPLPPSPIEEAQLRKRALPAPPPPSGKLPTHHRVLLRKHTEQIPPVTYPETQMPLSQTVQRNHKRKSRRRKQLQHSMTRRHPQTKTRRWKLTTRRMRLS